MKFGVVGPGALGTFLAGILAKKNDVILFGRREISLEEINIEGKTNIRNKIKYTNEPKLLCGLDCILICTKSYDTKNAINGIIEFLEGDEYLLSLQNGLKNEEILARFVGANRVIGGITGHGITYIGPGKVIHAGEGDTIIGSYSGTNNRMVTNVAAAFKESGIDVDVTDNIYGYIWKKVIVNSGINPLTALTRLRNGEILEYDFLHDLMIETCKEAKKVGKKEVTIPGSDPIKETEKVAHLTAKNRSSMLQDIENKRKTEIGCINGAVIDVGRKYGVKTPYNETLYSLVRGKEKSYLSDNGSPTR
ncbi:MAG: ketopantoate reductase family protein [Thermoplasmatota archaeon]